MVAITAAEGLVTPVTRTGKRALGGIAPPSRRKAGGLELLADPQERVVARGDGVLVAGRGLRVDVMLARRDFDLRGKPRVAESVV